MTVKVVILIKPQISEIGSDENDVANKYAWDQYGRTTTHSIDDCLSMLRAGNEESYAIVAYPYKPSQVETVKRLEEEGFRYTTILTTSNPLTGLVLGHLFAYRYRLTSLFNDPRDYDGDGVYDDLHEGLDGDLVGGPVNNTVQVLCAYPGVVERSVDSRGAYGRHVRVQHERNGSPFFTWYCHLDTRTAPAVGQPIAQGANVGEVGSTGNTTGEHVHFNLQAPGYGLSGYVVPDVVDPEPHMAAGRETLPLVGLGYDMGVYFVPPGNGLYGDIIVLENNWGEQEERQQLQRVGSISYVTKNQQWEKRTITADRIYFNLDTSPGNGEYYTVESTTGWMPRYWFPGQTFNRQEITRFYRKSDCRFLRQSNWATPLTFYAIHPEWTSQAGIKFPNVAELHWIVNGRVDEKYFFGVGLGLVGWEKYDGKKSWAKEHIPVGGQQNNTRETGCFS